MRMETEIERGRRNGLSESGELSLYNEISTFLLIFSWMEITPIDIPRMLDVPQCYIEIH